MIGIYICGCIHLHTLMEMERGREMYINKPYQIFEALTKKAELQPPSLPLFSINSQEHKM